MNSLQASTAKPCFSSIPLNLRLEYDYSNFGSQELQTIALETLQQFFGFVHHTFVRGLEIGRSFRQILQELCEENGSTEGAQLFDEWLESSDFGGSTWMARSLIQVSQWFDSQRQRIQKLILNSVQSWSISAVKELTKISDEHLLVKLLKSGKQTVASIRQTRKTITLGQPATLADWRLISYASCEMDEESLATLQAEALRLAQMSQPNAAESVVLTDHLVEAVQTLTEWNISKLIKPQHKRKTNPAISAFLSNCGDPNEVVPEAQLQWIERGLGLDAKASQEFRACVQNLAQAEAGNSGKAVAKHHHLQQALAQQKLAPAVPKSSDRMAQLERQVRDLSAQLKEADKAMALIHALQAQRDRLEQENQELQGLIQENAQKDLEIHLLQQQLAQVEATRSDAVLEQLRQQNQQLLSQLDQTQQRYDALTSEMAASKQNMKYSDNSTLVAKVMALEAELAEQTQNSQQPTTPAQNPQVETYKSLLAQMAHPIPASPVNEGDRVLVVKPEHPATGEFVTVTTEPDSVNFVNIQTDAGATWHICAEDLRLEAMLGDSGLDSISETFAAAASKQRLPGWTEKGYRSPYGLFYRGWAAIAQFAESVLQSESAVFMG
ncbi:ATG16 family protein [Laspinema sp. D1]|uniref:ATG16 family protein n=1 Tax=Laspinema palackyanum D2a TaxID=2953684 RepID=A0ABT2MJX2_9CYAN|nr:ATG16 family protein [Laspinema sp. D2a]